MSYAAKAWYASLVAFLTGIVQGMNPDESWSGLTVTDLVIALLAGIVAWGGVYGIENKTGVPVVVRDQQGTPREIR